MLGVFGGTLTNWILLALTVPSFSNSRKYRSTVRTEPTWSSLRSSPPVGGTSCLTNKRLMDFNTSSFCNNDHRPTPIFSHILSFTIQALPCGDRARMALPSAQPSVIVNLGPVSARRSVKFYSVRGYGIRAGVSLLVRVDLRPRLGAEIAFGRSDAVSFLEFHEGAVGQHAEDPGRAVPGKGCCCGAARQ